VKYPDLEGASCNGLDIEMFFPVTAKDEDEIRPLLEVMCSTCSVYTKCFNYALSVQVDGYWAGTTESDRKALRAEKGIVAQNLSNDVRTLFYSDTPKAVRIRERKRKEETA
jgi:hypothetical protein